MCDINLSKLNFKIKVDKTRTFFFKQYNHRVTSWHLGNSNGSLQPDQGAKSRKDNQKLVLDSELLYI